MTAPADIEELIAGLDPAAGAVVETLRQSVEELKAALTQRDAENARLAEQLADLRRMVFGKRSEKLPPIESEVRRVVEADEVTLEGEPMPSEPKAKAKEKRRKARKKSEPERKKNRKLRKNLPVIHERIEVSVDQLPEGYKHEDFRELGDGEVVRRIEHVREHLVVVEYTLQKLASKDGDHIVKAEAPPSVLDGGHYGPGVYAHIITSKCDDSMPLYRIARMLERAGYPIARSTLCSFFHRAAELLMPIYLRILDAAKHDPYLHADETTFRIQAKGKCLVGWIWGLLSKRAIAYTFDMTRKGEVAQRLLGGTEGFIMLDGYAGYNSVVEDDRVRVACWAHARRKFFEALLGESEARQMLDLIVELYRIEHKAAELGILGTEKHLALRQGESAYVIESIKGWLDERRDAFPPKSKMAIAIGYAINRWEDLKRFLEDPRLPLDNNFAERGLRLFALGRKTFLFAGHVEGAQNLAVLQSIVTTCRLHGVNPYEYIKDVLIRIQTHPAADIDQLLPWNWAPGNDPGSQLSPDS